MRSKTRRGTSLIETLVLSTLTSLILTTLTLLTHSLLTSTRRVTDHAQVRQAAYRLQSQVFADQAQANSSAIYANSSDGLLWKLKFANEEAVEYRLTARTVERTRISNSAALAQRDQFRLPPTYRYRVAIEADQPDRLDLQIEEERTGSKGETDVTRATGLRIRLENLRSEEVR